MGDIQKRTSQDPKVTLQAAIEELDVFTRLEASRLEVGEDGRLVAAKESRLERVVSLARCFIGPFFSDQIRKEQEKRLLKLKKAILKARDIIQSHSALIEKFKEGDESQRRLAELALIAIERYNAIVVEDSFDVIKSDVYSYERQRLLLDQEIKGQKIELPYTVSIQYASHPETHPAHKTLKELSAVLCQGATRKNKSAISPTYKKSMQVMIDSFHVKARRLIESDPQLQRFVSEIVPLIKQTLPEIDEESCPDSITMWQFIEIDSGFVFVTGCFNRNHSHSKFIVMPVVDSFSSIFQLKHTGFPYPSQHTGWALTDKWVDASPLRSDQTPLFQQLNQKKKNLMDQLRSDPEFLQKFRFHFKMKREIFDQNRHLFLPLYIQLQETLQQEVSLKSSSVLKTFYQELTEAFSPFDLIVEMQQQILDFFITKPMKYLKEEWLGVSESPLRLGSAQEKFEFASLSFQQQREQVQQQLDLSSPHHAYLLQQGLVVGKAFQSIALQYQSEKMGFAPPILNPFERKLQACAFQQLLAFLNECEDRLDILDPAQIKSDLLISYSKDLQLLEANEEDEHSLSIAIVNELKHYFNSRFSDLI